MSADMNLFAVTYIVVAVPVPARAQRKWGEIEKSGLRYLAMETRPDTIQPGISLEKIGRDQRRVDFPGVT